MSKIGVMHKAAALLPVLLVSALSPSSVSATPVLLGSVQTNGDTLAKTCFDNSCTQQELINGNSSTTSPDSTAQTTTVTTTTAPSISARAESDVLPAGGSVPNSFTSISTAEATLQYFFAIVGPQNISVEVHAAATGSISVTGNFASTGYSSYLAEARLIIPVAPLQEIFIDGGVIGPNQVQTKSNSFSINGTFDLDTNTAYEVLMSVSAGTGLIQLSTTTALANLIATASIDPSFQLDPFYANDYSIVFSDGIGDATSATPLPATLPLFAGGLGFLGYLTRRKKRNGPADRFSIGASGLGAKS